MTRITALLLAGFTALSPWMSGCTEEPTRRPHLSAPIQSVALPLPSAAAALVTLQKDLVQLKREQAKFRDAIAAMGAVLAQRPLSCEPLTPTCSGQEEEGPEAPPNDGPLAADAEFSAVFQVLDRHFAQEAEDPRWSQQAEFTLASFFQSADRSPLQSVECRATLCQLELQPLAGEAPHQLLARLPQEPPFDGERMLQEVQDDETTDRIVVYLARAGYGLGIE